MQLAAPRQIDVIEELKAKKIHVVSAATMGLTNFSAYCEFSCGIQLPEQEKYVKPINEKKETGTLWPKANITILPCGKGPYGEEYTPGGNYAEADILRHLRDAFIAERDYVKSGFMVFDFGCCWVDHHEYNRCIKKLLAEEFSDLPGEAAITE